MDLFNIPLIFITAVIGFITGIGLTYPYINIILGAGSVMVSILKSILAYKKLSERSENHRICSLQFSQVSKEIKLELSLRREDRQPVKQMLHIVKVKLKNLLEVAELVEDFIIEKFKTLYPHCKQTHARSLPSNFYGLAQFEIQTTKDQLEYINEKHIIDVEIKQKEQKRQELVACEMEEIERKRQNDAELISFRLKKQREIEEKKLEFAYQLELKMVTNEYHKRSQNINSELEEYGSIIPNLNRKIAKKPTYVIQENYPRLIHRLERQISRQNSPIRQRSPKTDSKLNDIKNHLQSTLDPPLLDINQPNMIGAPPNEIVIPSTENAAEVNAESPRVGETLPNDVMLSSDSS
jgi:hypothetical protein